MVDCSRAPRTWIGLLSVEESVWILERLERRSQIIRGSALAAIRNALAMRDRLNKVDTPEGNNHDYRPSRWHLLRSRPPSASRRQRQREDNQHEKDPCPFPVDFSMRTTVPESNFYECGHYLRLPSQERDRMRSKRIASCITGISQRTKRVRRSLTAGPAAGPDPIRCIQLVVLVPPTYVHILAI